MLFFEVQAVYQRQTGEDNPAYVKETYMVESLTPSSARDRRNKAVHLWRM